MVSKSLYKVKTGVTARLVASESLAEVVKVFPKAISVEYVDTCLILEGEKLPDAVRVMIRFKDKVKNYNEWVVFASESDGEKQFRAHLEKYRPGAEFLGWSVAE